MYIVGYTCPWIQKKRKRVPTGGEMLSVQSPPGMLTVIGLQYSQPDHIHRKHNTPHSLPCPRNQYMIHDCQSSACTEIYIANSKTLPSPAVPHRNTTPAQVAIALAV